MSQEPELDGAQCNRLVSYAHFVGSEIQVELAIIIRRALFLARGLAGPAQDRPQTGDELPGTEGLGDVVVRPHLEPDQLVDLLLLGREDQDRDSRGPVLAPQDAAKLDALHAGKHQIQDDRIGEPLLHLRITRLCVRRTQGLEALLLQVVTDQFTDVQLVLDNEYLFHFLSP